MNRGTTWGRAHGGLWGHHVQDWALCFVLSFEFYHRCAGLGSLIAKLQAGGKKRSEVYRQKKLRSGSFATLLSCCQRVRGSVSVATVPGLPDARLQLLQPQVGADHNKDKVLHRYFAPSPPKPKSQFQTTPFYCTRLFSCGCMFFATLHRL